MGGFIFLAVFLAVIAKITDLVLISHAYDIAKGLGKNPPAAGLIFGFVEGLFWQRILEIADETQSKLLKRYLLYHKVLIMIMISGIVAVFMLTAIQYSK